MKIITIEEEAWKQLNSRINAIADYLKRLTTPATMICGSTITRYANTCTSAKRLCGVCVPKAK
ncbi:hypothetical protein KRR40_02755 [Niabella defluvii]|nr:hypothetical protein KRR40_02755 [Niabella sp. I65]